MRQMNKAILLALPFLAGCAAPYLPTSAYPPTPDVHAAKRSCAYVMMAETQGADYGGLIGGLMVAPERDAIFDDCMRSHGYAHAQ